MQLQFTDNAKTALQLGTKVARSLHQNYIGTEHILVGLLKEKTGVAATVLSDNGVDESKVIELIKNLIAPTGITSVKDRDGYSPRALKILVDSHKQAEHFHSTMTGTEHILIALIKEGDNVAVRLLNTMGIHIQKLYIDLLVAMGEDTSLYKEELNSKPNRKKKIQVHLTNIVEI